MTMALESEVFLGQKLINCNEDSKNFKFCLCIFANANTTGVEIPSFYWFNESSNVWWTIIELVIKMGMENNSWLKQFKKNFTNF